MPNASRCARSVAGLLLAMMVSGGGGGCGGAATAAIGAAGGELEGELVTYVADYRDGHEERRHYVRLASGDRVRLLFADAPDAVTGDHIAVAGRSTTSGLQVDRYSVARVAAERGAQPNLWGPKRAMKIAFILVDVGKGSNVTVDQARRLAFGTDPGDRSLKQFYEESSFGAVKVSGEVFGPFRYDLSTCSDGEIEGLATEMTAQVPNAAEFQHLMFYFGSDVEACGWGGLGMEGTASRPQRNSWINGYTNCSIVMHEPGHNIGLMHGNTLVCSGRAFDGAPDVNCTSREYGTRLSPMGSGCRQLNVFERWYEGWLPGCRVVRVGGSGSFNLVPIERNCGAVHALQIPMATTRSIKSIQGAAPIAIDKYYVEMRQSLGLFDQGLSPSVMIYATSDIQPANRSSVWSWQLDMDPSTSSFDGLRRVGESFTDPAGGVSITLTKIGEGGATLQVEMANGAGGPTCADGSPFAGPGQEECVEDGGDVDGSSDTGGETGDDDPDGDLDALDGDSTAGNGRASGTGCDVAGRGGEGAAVLGWTILAALGALVLRRRWQRG